MGVQVVNTMHEYYYSILSRGETNDCVVRAFASATGSDYQAAHDLCRLSLGRKSRKVTPGVVQFLTKGELLGKKVTQLGEGHADYINLESFPWARRMYTTYNNYCPVERKVVPVKRAMTVGTFLKLYTKGTYLIRIDAHMFTIKDGVVYGNTEDSKRLRARVIHAWKVE